MPQFEITLVQHAEERAKRSGYNFYYGYPIRSPYRFNERQLVAGMVRSILQRNAGRMAKRYLAAIVKPTLRFLIDWSAAPRFCLELSATGSLRDFSFTSRIGELGQGVSYCYWHWTAGYQIISDYASWASVTGAPVGGASATPDYVMFNPDSGRIDLMESKGTCSKAHLSRLGSALKQCRSVFGQTLATGYWGSVLTLEPSLATAELHVRDPQSERRPTFEERYRLFRMGYASWFDLQGESDYAQFLRSGSLDQSGDPVAQRNEGPPRDPLALMTAEALGFEPESVRFTLDPQVVEALRERRAFEKIEWDRLRKMASVDDQGFGVLRFPDGTEISDAPAPAKTHVVMDE